MAATAPNLRSDISGYLNPEQAGAIFEKAAQQSVVQRMARKVPLGVNGQAIMHFTSDPVAEWVAEGGLKPESTPAMESISMLPKKVAVIVPASAELVRSNPAGYLLQVQDKMAGAFAKAFDAAVLHGTSTPFSAYLDQTTKAVELGAHTAAEGGAWADLTSAMRLLANDGRDLTGWAFDSVVEPQLLGSVDANGRPIFVTSTDVASLSAPAPFDTLQVRMGALMGRPAFLSKTVGTTNKTTVVGYAGDWSQAAWGMVGDITYTVSTEAALTINGALVSAFEKNLVGIRAETEMGFAVSSVAHFCRISNTVGS